MEKQKEGRMILDLEESLELCDWLLEKGIGLGEAAHVICDLACGDSFAIALLKVFKHRQLKLEEIHAKNPLSNLDDPIAY